MLLDQSKMLEDLARQMKQRESLAANKQEMPASVERAISELRSRCERLEADKQHLAEQVTRQAEFPELERPNRLELKQTQLELSTLRSEFEDLKYQLSQVTREKDRYKAEKEMLERELEDVKETQKADRPAKDYAGLQGQIARLQQQNKELLNSYHSLQKEFDQMVVERRNPSRGIEKKPQPGTLNIFDQSQPYGEEAKLPKKDNHDIIQNLESKLYTLQSEKQRVSLTQLTSELERMPDSKRREDLSLECDILDTNINSLKQKLKKYNKLT